MNPSIFSCVICDYNTGNKKDFNKHKLTAKHIHRTNRTYLSQHLSPTVFRCDCGKEYKARNSLWYHKQKCNLNCDTQSLSTNILNDDNRNDFISTSNTQPNMILELLRENKEFKQLMLDQNKQMQDIQSQLIQSYAQNVELQNNMVEIFKEGKTINNNTTNNNNQRFNLNFFLNDTCKDAMNITDFLRNLNIHIDEIEYIGNHGYVNGMTKMIMERLKGMDITKRPIHCTDIKRETMYIKDKDEWSKDTDELSKLRKILGRITMNNYRTVPEWKIAHPECEVMDTRSYDFCYKMMRAILGDVEDEQIKMDNKIIKTMAKDLFVNKNHNK